MKRFPKLAILALVLYFAFILGGSFHSHTSGSDAHCNLCQLSHVSADFNGHCCVESEVADFGAYQPDVSSLHIDLLSIPSFGRAPPLS